MTINKKWWSKDTVAVVTGANKGIGYEIVKAFADQGLTVVLTARDQVRGQAAVDRLKASGQKSVWFHQLDVQSSESVQTLATWLKKQFDGIDILVNNAGVISGPDPGAAGIAITYENAKLIVNTNYYGTKNVTEGLFPLLRSSPAAARIVNVTSRGAFYERLKGALKQTFRDEDNYTKELSDSLAAKYLKDVKAGRSEEEGWIPNSSKNAPMYSESKMFLNVYAIALAKSLAKSQLPEDHQVLVSNFCPGVTKTDLLDRVVSEGFEAPPGFNVKTSADGADTGVWLALLPKEELADKVGKFYGEREQYPFGMKNPPLQ